MNVPTVPATCSVALSKRDRAFIESRRSTALALRAEKLRARVFRVSAAVAVAAWSYNLSVIFGGA